MKSIALALLLALVSFSANAQTKPALKVEPKMLIFSIGTPSVKRICTKPGQVIKIKLTTNKSIQEFTLDPGDRKQKDPNPLAPSYSIHLDNSDGQLGLLTGLKVEITTPDGKTWIKDPMRLPAGKRNDWTEIYFSFIDKWDGDATTN